MNSNVLVYGAYGHTGRFVVPELLRRGLTPILAGRDPARLGHAWPASSPAWRCGRRPWTTPSRLRTPSAAPRLVVNCAGPFLDTAVPVAAAAVRAGAHYLDVTAEQAAAQQVYRAHEELGWRADVAVIPRWRSTADSPTC